MSTYADRAPAFNCADQTARSWLQRAEVCAGMVAAMAGRRSQPASIADIGCGDEKLLAALKACGLDCSYTGYDLLPQASHVHRFDVRCDVLPEGHDIAVMMGVIEYLPALEDVLRRLARQAPALVVSHVVRKGKAYSPERLVELGWVNHLGAEELEALLLRAGYAVIARRMTPDDKTLMLACEAGRSA